MTVKINRQLHLVIPIQQGERTLHAHSTPIASETFDAFFLPMAKAFSAIYTEGLGVIAGPRVAAKLLKKVSESMNQWDEVKTGLVNEIYRLTNVFAPSDNGWKMIPLEDAIKTNVIDKDDASEVENAIVFFTLAWHMHKKTEREQVIKDAALLWGARAEYLSCTDFRDSLLTLTKPEVIGKKVA